MSIKDKFTNMVNKVSDAVVDAKATFEKTCMEVTCYSLNDIRKEEQVMVKFDDKSKNGQFSGNLEIELKQIPRPWLFITDDGNYFEVDEKHLKQEVIEVQLKSKIDKHETTHAAITRVQLVTK